MNLRQVIKREFIKTKKKSNICRLHESTFTHEEIYSATKSLLSGKITMGKLLKLLRMLMPRNMALNMQLW